MERRCATCVYWQGSVNLCRRRAPAVKAGEQSWQGDPVFPRAAPNEWCGEWEPLLAVTFNSPEPRKVGIRANLATIALVIR